MTRINAIYHFYWRTDDGLLHHDVRPLVGEVCDFVIRCEVVPLLGWPTPAMRPSEYNSDGRPTVYIGCDLCGRPVETQL